MRGDGYRCQLTVLLTLLILFPCGAGVWAQETGAVVQGEVALTPFEERLPPEEPAPVSGGTSQTVILSGTPTRGSLTSSDGGLPSIEFSGFEEQYVIDTNAFCWKQNWGRVSVPSECSGGEYDAGLCYPKCGEGYHGRANLCWRDCPEGYVDDGLTCRRPPHTVSKLSYGRTAGVPMICAPGQEAEGPLGPCYQACRDGYVGVGTVCWQDSCPEGYQNDPFTCRKDPIIEAKHSYDRGFGTPMVCGPGLEQIGGLCYPACRAGYHGELDWCRQPCPPGFHDDGVTCSAPPHATSADTSACPGWDLCCLTTHRGQSKCPEGYRNDGCTCFRDAKVIPQVSYHRGQEPLSTCPAGMDRAGGGALCYPNCRDGYVGNGPRCWSTCPEGYIDEPGTCRIEGNVLGKKSEGRGVGVAVSACPEGFEKDDTSALCYPQCAEDYHGVGPVCWNDTSDAAVREGCPAGYRDDGLTCTRDVHIFGNESQDRGVGVIPACAEDEVEESAGLCYKACERGFDTVGPVCWQQCPGNVPYEFGAACAGNQLAATAALGDMIFSAIDVLMNAVTVGGWTGAKIGLAGAETGAEAGIKLSKSDKLFKKIAQNLIKKNPLTKNPGEDAADFLKRKLSKKLADSKMQIFLREIDSELPKVLKMDLGGERTEDALLLIGELLDEGKITLEALSFLDVTGLYDLVDAFIRPTCETLPPGAFVVQPIQIGDQPTHGFGLLAGLQSRSAPETAPGAQPTPEPVADTSAPEIVPVADPEVECASPEGTVVALGAPSVMDDSGQAGVGVVAPERYPLGATTVTWKAIDAAGNQASATNLVTVVDTTPPMIVAAAAEVSAECTSAAGTPVTLATTGSDACDGQVELTSDAPEAFPPGKTTVTWTAVDDAGNRSSGSQTVAVLDTAPPEITVADLTTECTSAAGAAVALEAEVSDQCDAEIELDSDAPERFPLGATTVRWEARDDADNQASAIQTVTVIDTTPPVIRVADLSVECLLVDGTPADLGASVSDLCESEVGLESDAPLRFPLGATQVTWRAQDAAGNLATATQTVTVADTTPPRITCPDDLVVEPTGPEGASISFAATGSDACSRATERECSPPSGGSFAIASETPVSCRATDAAGLESDCSFTVKVLSVKEVVSSLSSRLTGLRDSDRITADQAERRLTKAAARIERLIDQGKTRKACNQLEKAVVERVRTLVAKAMLPFEQGEAIIASADNVRAALECSQLRTRERRGE